MVKQRWEGVTIAPNSLLEKVASTLEGDSIRYEEIKGKNIPGREESQDKIP